LKSRLFGVIIRQILNAHRGTENNRPKTQNPKHKKSVADKEVEAIVGDLATRPPTPTPNP